MEPFLLVLTLRTSIMLSLLHPVNQELEIYNQLEEYLEKERIKLKQSCTTLSDDCTYNSRKNYTLNHLIERIKIYNEENFNYEITTIHTKEKWE
jgi:hypothetical protein